MGDSRHCGRYHTNTPRHTLLMFTNTPRTMPIFSFDSLDQPWMLNRNHLDVLNPPAEQFFRHFGEAVEPLLRDQPRRWQGLHCTGLRVRASAAAVSRVHRMVRVDAGVLAWL